MFYNAITLYGRPKWKRYLFNKNKYTAVTVSVKSLDAKNSYY